MAVGHLSKSTQQNINLPRIVDLQSFVPCYMFYLICLFSRKFSCWFGCFMCFLHQIHTYKSHLIVVPHYQLIVRDFLIFGFKAFISKLSRNSTFEKNWKNGKRTSFKWKSQQNNHKILNKHFEPNISRNWLKRTTNINFKHGIYIDQTKYIKSCGIQVKTRAHFWIIILRLTF